MALFQHCCMTLGSSMMHVTEDLDLVELSSTAYCFYLIYISYLCILL